MASVAILGCGPAGLMAAHALARKDIPFNIYSKPVKSFISGAQYLHRPIPEVSESAPDGSLTFVKVGDYRVYGEKVYGQRYGNSSWGNYSEHPAGVPAWSLETAYDALWKLYGELVRPCSLTPAAVRGLRETHEDIISTIPKPELCDDPNHEFRRANIWITEGTKAEISNTIIYNGKREDQWCRTSLIFGHGSTEWGTGAQMNESNARKFVKPIFNDCDCHPGVIYLGRFGQWRRGVLVHEAYEGAEECVVRLAVK